MDGSARFIKSSINLSIWNAPGTRAGGEVITRGCLLIGPIVAQGRSSSEWD